MRWLAVLLLAAGCGEDTAGPQSIAIGCVLLDLPVAFDTPGDFARARPGTLAGWSADGRWFLTGAQFGPSSVHLRRTGGSVVVDRNPAFTGSVDSSELFARLAVSDPSGTQTITAVRISNLSADGTARVERGRCVGNRCTRCTGQLIRATRNAGEGEGQGISLVGQLADPTWGKGYTFNVRVLGTVAYLIRQDGLHIIETADPAHPVELGHYKRPMLGYSNDVKLVAAGDRRFAVIADTPVDVVDVTDPHAPALAAQIPEGAHTVFTETRGATTLAYFGGLDGTCPVYDVTDPAVPQLLGRYSAGSSLVHDLSIAGGIAYLSAWEGGFHVVDFTAPAAPRLVGIWAPTPIHASHSNWTTVAGGRHVALHGEEGYNAKLDIIDVDPASPAFMTPIASWQTRPWISIHNLMAFGTKAYFTYYQDGVRVLDVSDPRHPVQVGYYNTWDPQADYASSAFFESAVGLDVDQARKLIFVADSPRGLLILHDDTP
ncbi:MAG: hypothetical protein E6J90_48045 [Deltaproteobacteria bacterium]|nr:MAG: hypothetical protein E6J90_48045 [Deltaproteobacteria bacterium]